MESSRAVARASLLVVVAALACLAAAPGASAAIHRDRGADVHVRGLTGKERRALDIRSIQVTGGRGPLTVRVKLAGNLEDAEFSGHLGHPGAVLVLRRSSGRSTVVGLTGAGKPLGRGPGGPFAVSLRGRTLEFFVAKAAGAPASLEVKTFASTSRIHRARAVAAAPGEVQRMANGEGADEAAITRAKLKGYSCAELEKLLSKVRDDVESARGSGGAADADLEDLKNKLEEARSTHAAPDEIKRLEEDVKEAQESNDAYFQRFLALVAYEDAIAHRLSLCHNGGGQPQEPVAQCSNGQNDDPAQDQLVDLADPGCEDGSDNDEKNVEETIPCPGPGEVIQVWLDLRTPATNKIVNNRLVIIAGGVVVHNEDSSGHPGATDLGTALCGAGIRVTLRNGAGQDAPNPGGDVPPPATSLGEQTFRWLIKLENLGSGNARGTEVKLRGMLKTVARP
jgi:hypothetical protein